MKCKHENTPVDPRMVRETLEAHGGMMIARRQCAICNQTLEAQRPLPKNFAKEGFDVFYDWDADSWEPVSQHPAYQAMQLARITPAEDVV